MSKGSGTRSGLLWQVERLLMETEELPQVLLMENVPQVHGKKNLDDFNKWLEFLESKGYHNYWKDLNAKNYGVAQNRNRTFMISLLDDIPYHFPEPIPLTKKMKDYLEDEVDEKYYINNDKAQTLIKKLIADGELKSDKSDAPTDKSIKLGHMGVGGQKGYLYSDEGITDCLPATQYKDPTKILVNNDVEPLNPMPDETCRTIKSQYYKTSGANFERTMQGGNLQPMVIEEPKVLGGLGEKKSNGGTQYFQQDRVYSSDGIAMAHPANLPGGSYKYMMKEPVIVAMRGRNPDNPSDRRAGIELEQRLEPQQEGICNTLTSVQKDNLVVEQKPISTKGKEIDVASTILCGYHRTNMTEFNADNGVMERVKIKQATEKGYAECDVGGVADLSYPTSKTRRGRVQEHGQVSPALTVSGVDGIRKIESEYRIRKLTPLECWRLMGFTDEEFHKAEEVNSNTQLYKQAGNSIVVDVLEAIFKELMEVLDMTESQTYRIEGIKTDMMIDLVKFREREPQLFEELCKDYPAEHKNYLITVV